MCFAQDPTEVNGQYHDKDIGAPLTFFVSVCYRPTPSSPWSWVWTWRTSPPVRSWWFPRSPPGHSTTRSRSGCTTPRAGCWSYSSRSSSGRGDPCRLVSVSKLKVDNIETWVFVLGSHCNAELFWDLKQLLFTWKKILQLGSYLNC